MAIGKPLGLFMPFPILSRRVGSGCGWLNVTIRPMPVPGWDASSGDWGMIGRRVCGTVVVVGAGTFERRRVVWLGCLCRVQTGGLFSTKGSSSLVFEVLDVVSVSESSPA